MSNESSTSATRSFPRFLWVPASLGATAMVGTAWLLWTDLGSLPLDLLNYGVAGLLLALAAGGAARVAGGHGLLVRFSVAVLALLGLLSGFVWLTHDAVQESISLSMSTRYTRDGYDQLAQAAEAFAELPESGLSTFRQPKPPIIFTSP